MFSDERGHYLKEGVGGCLVWGGGVAFKGVMGCSGSGW